MTTNICVAPGCGQPRPAHAFLCNDCTKVLEQDLASIPALVADLNITISRQDVLATGSGRPAADAGLAYKPAAADTLYNLSHTITGWVRVLLEDTRTTIHDPGDPITGARFLLLHVRSLAIHPAADEAIDEIAYAVKEAYRVIDQAPHLFAGPCRTVSCDAYLYADPDSHYVTCRDCQTEYVVAERRQWMIDAAAELHVTATVARSWVFLLMAKDVHPKTWRSWIDRERLLPVAADGGGHPLYRFGQVRDLAISYVTKRRAA